MKEEVGYYRSAFRVGNCVTTSLIIRVWFSVSLLHFVFSLVPGTRFYLRVLLLHFLSCGMLVSVINLFTAISQ
jgi:fumarate reductase subunit C